MKVIFMGTPDFAVQAFKKIALEHEILAVYTRAPKPAGKGLNLTKSPIHLEAENLNIPVFCPKTLRNPQEQENFKNLNADVGVVCAYGLILPTPILTGTTLGCINIHASLLPRWRGASPIQRAIQAGDSKTGVTIMQMDEGLDTGDMLLKGEIPITSETTFGSLHDELAFLGANLIIKVLQKIPTPIKQSEEGTCYASKIEKEEALIQWNQTATEIERLIRALYPYPQAYFVYKNQRIKVQKAIVEPGNHSQKLGSLLDDKGLIACGKGTLLRLKRVQREGKKPMDLNDFLKGFELLKGEVL